MTGSDLVPRTATVMVVHLAVGAVFTALVEPWLAEDIIVHVEPETIGIVAGSRTDDRSTWIGDATFDEGQLPPTDAVRTLLAPVLTRISITAPAPRAAIDALVARDLETLGQHSIATGDSRVTSARVDQFLDHLGRRPHSTARLVRAEPDHGPPVTITIPTPCCVLAKQPGPHACPTCPSRTAQDRDASIRTWLEQMDDDSFERVAGRPRVPPPDPDGTPPHAA